MIDKVMDKFLFFVARKGRVLSPIVPGDDFVLSRKFLLIILIEKREMFMGCGGVMAPDRANKNFKKGRCYGQMSKNGNIYYFTLLGCKGW